MGKRYKLMQIDIPLPSSVTTHIFMHIFRLVRCDFYNIGMSIEVFFEILCTSIKTSGWEVCDGWVVLAFSVVVLFLQCLRWWFQGFHIFCYKHVHPQN